MWVKTKSDSWFSSKLNSAVILQKSGSQNFSKNDFQISNLQSDFKNNDCKWENWVVDLGRKSSSFQKIFTLLTH